MGNTWDSLQVESCGAQRLIPHILVGGEEILDGRHEKPHPSIFERWMGSGLWLRGRAGGLGAQRAGAAVDTAGRCPCMGACALPGQQRWRLRSQEACATFLACRACELAQCRPEEAIHVGDSLKCDVQVCPLACQLALSA